MKIAFNPSTVAALTAPPNNKDITFDLRGRNIFARGVKFYGTDTNTWRPVVDNLTSNSTTSSLSANQGRVLKALIDGKSDSGHNHDGRYLKLTGGTMTSNALIRFADSGSWGTDKGPQGARGGLYWSGQSDYAKLYAEETAGNNLDLVIQFGDDNSNGLSIRNKSNVQTSYISAGGVITTGTFKGNLDWSYITNKPATATRWPSWAEVTGKPSSFTPSTHTHGLSNSVFFLNMPSISGNAKWKEIFGYPVNYNLLLSVRINSPAPEWCVGNYGSGILYGGSDTKGFMSSAYNEPLIMWAGGNGSSDDSVPKWYIGIRGTHKSIYNLTTIASEANAAYNLRHSHANKSVLDGITSGLVSNWNTAYTFVHTITGTDTDNVINKWDEIVNFLAGITEDNKLNTLLNSKLSIQQLSAKDILTTKTNNALFWVNTVGTASSITTGPFTDHPYALLSVTNYSQNDTNGKFFYRSRLAFSSAGDIKVASCHHQGEYKQDDAWYNVLTSKNSGISGSTIKLNGTSITVYSSGTADGRYVKKSGDTMSGALNFANNTWNQVGDDVAIGDHNVAGCLGIKGLNASPGLAFYNSSNTLLSKLVGTTSQFQRVSGDNTYTIIDTASPYITNGVYVFDRSEIGTSPNYDNPGKNGLFEIRSSSEVTGETGTRPGTGYGPFLNLKTPDNVAMLQISGIGNSLYFRARQAASVTMAGVSWKKVLDTGNSYVKDGKGVINWTTITQVDNATNATNSTNARKLVNWYSSRPTSLNAQFGDGSLRIFYATSSTTEGKPAEDSHILHLAWDNTGGWDAQLAVHTRSGKVSTRAQNGGTWQPWKTLAFTTDIPTSLKNPHALTISLNGTSQGPYDGSATKNINITPGSIGAATSVHTHDYLVVNTADDKSFNSAYHNFQVLYASGSNEITGKPANVDAFGLFRFRTAFGWSGQMLLANGGSLYIRSSEDAKMTNTLAWKTILDSSNYSGILDSRYYTESEVNSLLSKKLDRVNLTTGTWNPRGYSLAADYHYNGGDLSISENGGKMYVSIDGQFYQNEGQYRVLDTSDIGSIRGGLTLYQYLSATDANWYPLVWGGSDHKNTNNSTGSLYKSYDKLSWQTSSQTLYATRLQTTDITFPNSGTSMRGIQGTVGDNDFWRIKGGATASNSGYLEIATANEGNEPIYVRQYTGTFGTIKRTLTLLDTNGFAHFPSYISIGGNENNNSSPDRVWGSNSSDSYLRSYRTSALRVAYAVNANLATTASSANKLTTARNIALGTDLRGSANFDGSSNIIINANINACTIRVNSTNELPFKRIAHFETGNSYNDNALLLYISQGYINGSNGICRVEFRTNSISSSSTSITASAAVRWLVRNGYGLDSLYAGYYVTAGKAYIDIYLKTTGSYQGTVIRVLQDSRGGINSNVQLINSHYYSDTDHKEAYGSIEAASTALYNRAYTRIVQGSDIGTVSYSNSTGSVHWNNVTNKPSSFNPAAHNHDGRYLRLDGSDIMTGILKVKANQSNDGYDGAINMNNSNIYGLNSIYTSDKSESQAEGIHFWRDTTHVDTLRMMDGKLLFTPNRPLGKSGTEQTVLHTGNSSVSGQTITINGNKTTWTNTWRPLGTGVNNAAAGNHTHDYLIINEADTNKFNSSYHNFQVLYAGGSNGIEGRPKDVDAFGLFRFRVAAGFSGQILLANGGDLYIRSAADASLNKSLPWKRVIDSGNIGSQSVAYASKAGSVAWSNVTGRPSSLKNPYSLNVFGVAYDGSAAKTVTTSTFISQVSEATSTITDGTMLITSSASNSGFADTNAVNVPYKRKAVHLWEYIKAKTDTLYSSKSHTHSYLPLAGGTMNANARISHDNGNLYIGRADNNGWVYTQDIASHTGSDKWNIRTSGAACFGSIHIASKTDASFNANVIECATGIYLNYFSSQNVSLCSGGGKVGIGTAYPGSYKLSVNGSAQMKSITLQAKDELYYKQPICIACGYVYDGPDYASGRRTQQISCNRNAKVALLDSNGKYRVWFTDILESKYNREKMSLQVTGCPGGQDTSGTVKAAGMTGNYSGYLAINVWTSDDASINPSSFYFALWSFED